MSKTILVTGGCGYLGAILVPQLIAEFPNSSIRIIDNMESGGYAALMAIPRNSHVEFLEADILDSATISAALSDVDVVVHLAAKYRSLISFEAGAAVEQVNHWGTARLIEGCLNANVSHFIYTSAASVYGDGGPHSEHHRCRPIGSYANSAAHAENEIRHAKERGMDYTILRLGAIYGYSAMMEFHSMVNRQSFLTALGKPPIVFGNGEQIRPIIHVNDAASAICFSIRAPGALNQVLNVASDNVSMLAAATAVSTVTSNKPTRFAEQDFRTRISFSLNCNLIRNLGWKPKYTLAEGATDIVERLSGVKSLTFARVE